MKNALNFLGATALLVAASASSLALAADDGPCIEVSEGSTGATVCALANELERGFVYPEVAERYSAMLQANLASGAYSEFSGEALAQRLTEDLQAVEADGHLAVTLVKAEQERRQRRAGERPPMVEQAGWIAPGVAFVRFNGFPDDAEVTAAAARFMEEYKDAETIIFDVRTNGGGGVQQMDVVFPWLFEKPTRLVTMATRRSIEEEMGAMFGAETLYETGSTPQEIVREHWAIPGKHADLLDAKVYLLTGPMTGSAGEHFALALKHTGRATLVGGATYGANHFGGETLLPGGFQVFIPVGRTYDPVTGKDWEGDGVAPDVEVASELALEWVLKDLGLSADEAKALSDARMPVQPMRKRAK